MNRIREILSRLSPAKRQEAQIALGNRLAGSARPAFASNGPSVSDNQRRVWVLHCAGAGAAYTISCAYRIQGDLDVRSLRRALQELLSRHETLRTGFKESAGDLVAVVHPAIDRLAVVDTRALPAAARAQYVDAAVQAQASSPFRFDGQPPLQIILYLLDARTFVLNIAMHHILCDQWSLEIMRRDLFELYSAFAAGRQPPAARSTAAIHSPYVPDADDESFWLKTLDGVPHYANLPVDRLPTAENNWRGECRYVSYAELGDAVAKFSAQRNCTTFHTLLAAFAIVYSRWVGSRDVCIGTRVAGRAHEDTADAIGFFVNFLPLRLTLQPDLTATQWLDAARSATISALEREQTPFEALLNLLKCERDTLLTPLIPVKLTYQNIPSLAGDEVDGLQIEALPHHNGTAKTELDLAFEAQGSTLQLAVEYRSSLFDWRTIETLIEQHKAALRWMLANPDAQITSFEASQAYEQRERAVLRGKTTARGGGSLSRRFADIALQNASSPAASDGTRTVTFAELEQMTAKAAAALLDSPAASSMAPVAIFIHANLDWLIAALACLRAGIPYIALDPGHPADFCEAVRQAAHADCIISQQEYPHDRSDIVRLRLDTLLAGSTRAPVRSLPEIPCDSLSTAYLLSTSGSTGTPKVASIPHRALFNCIDALQRAYPLDADDVVGMRTSPTFAPAVKQWLGGLLAGRPVVMLTPAVVESIEVLAKRIAQQSISRLYLVPSQIPYLAQQVKGVHRLASVRLLATGGEPASGHLWQDVRFAFPRARLLNSYGCSELADITLGEVRDAAELSAVGTPIDNTSVYLLSANLDPVPVGAVGEIFVAGESLGTGYFARADLTAAAYLPDPFSTASGARMFRTGDFGRVNADGNLVHLGRRDQQLKVNGCRVDAGHVASVMLSSPAVQRALVLARPNRDAENVLVAYICPELPPSEIATLRRYLLGKLPQFMQPSAIVPLAEFPLLNNGKVDHEAFPAPNWEEASADRVAPRTPVERTLASIWIEVLKVSEVGIHDNFFALGGHSMLAIQVLAAMKADFGIEISQATFFQSPTIKELAAHIELLQDPGAVPGEGDAGQTTAGSYQEGMPNRTRERILPR